MNFLKTKTTWSNMELGVLKLCAGTFYISIGIYFHEYLQKYLAVFIAFFFISVIYLLILWFKKEKIRE